MVEVARLVGIEKRSYRGQDGQEKFFCGLHLLYLEGSVNGVQGSKVESVSCPREPWTAASWRSVSVGLRDVQHPEQESRPSGESFAGRGTGSQEVSLGKSEECRETYRDYGSKYQGIREAGGSLPDPRK